MSNQEEINQLKQINADLQMKLNIAKDALVKIQRCIIEHNKKSADDIGAVVNFTINNMLVKFKNSC